MAKYVPKIGDIVYVIVEDEGKQRHYEARRAAYVEHPTLSKTVVHTAKCERRHGTNNFSSRADVFGKTCFESGKVALAAIMEMSKTGHI